MVKERLRPFTLQPFVLNNYTFCDVPFTQHERDDPSEIANLFRKQTAIVDRAGGKWIVRCVAVAKNFPDALNHFAAFLGKYSESLYFRFDQAVVEITHLVLSFAKGS